MKTSVSTNFGPMPILAARSVYLLLAISIVALPFWATFAMQLNGDNSLIEEYTVSGSVACGGFALAMIIVQSVQSVRERKRA